MPDGMVENQKFDTPIITPTTKADIGHDEDISREQILLQGIVNESDYIQLEKYTRAIFQRGTEMAAEKGLILVDTKYGQDIKLSIKEILKRIYRFKNFKSLNNSLKYIKFVNFNRTDKKFWSIEKLNEFLDSITKDLKYCKIKTIYLHCPPYGILNEDYLNNFTNLLEQKNITPGISGPNIKDLELIVKNFPLIKLQLSLNTFWNEKTKIVNKTVNVNINSILKTLHENKTKNLNYNIDFLENFEKILNENKHYNIILGINSLNSIEKLSSILLNFKNIKK